MNEKHCEHKWIKTAVVMRTMPVAIFHCEKCLEQKEIVLEGVLPKNEPKFSIFGNF